MLCTCTHLVVMDGLEQPTQASNKLAQCTLNDMFCLDSLMDSLSGSKVSLWRLLTAVRNLKWHSEPLDDLRCYCFKHDSAVLAVTVSLNKITSEAWSLDDDIGSIACVIFIEAGSVYTRKQTRHHVCYRAMKWTYAIVFTWHWGVLLFYLKCSNI